MSSNLSFEKKTITLSDDSIGQRIDATIASILIEIPRTKIQALIKKGKVYREHDQRPFLSPSERIKKLCDVIIEIPEEEDTLPTENADITLNIIFEDDDLIIINKQAGLTVHPGAGNTKQTLVNGLLHHTKGNLSNLSGNDRPGILHRLDKDTTGLMVVAKNNTAHAHLAEQIKTRTMKRTYQAIVWGTPSPREGSIETLIGRDEKNRTKMAVLEEGGKTAITHYQVQKPLGLHNSLIECKLETGRTHQIRVHMLHLGFPVIGDRTYRLRHMRIASLLGQASQIAIRNIKRQALHAYRLDFQHPISGEALSFTSELPQDMTDIIDSFK